MLPRWKGSHPSSGLPQVNLRTAAITATDYSQYHGTVAARGVDPR